MSGKEGNNHFLQNKTQHRFDPSRVSLMRTRAAPETPLPRREPKGFQSSRAQPWLGSGSARAGGSLQVKTAEVPASEGR